MERAAANPPACMCADSPLLCWSGAPAAGHARAAVGDRDERLTRFRSSITDLEGAIADLKAENSTVAANLAEQSTI